MVEFPLLHIIIFIAMSLSPADVETISIKRADTVIHLDKNNDAWKMRQGGVVWGKDKTTVKCEFNGTQNNKDVSSFINEDIAKVDWKTQDTYTNKFLSVLKTEEGFKVTTIHNGKEEESFEIVYKSTE